MILILPELPPPLHACFVNARGPGRVKSPRYNAWIQLCLFKLGRQQLIPGQVLVEYVFCRPDKRKRDLGNMEKAVSDILVKMNVIEDDSLIMDMRLRWGGDGPPVIITVEAWHGQPP